MKLPEWQEAERKATGLVVEATWALTGRREGAWIGRGLLWGYMVHLRERQSGGASPEFEVFVGHLSDEEGEQQISPAAMYHGTLEPEMALRALLEAVVPDRFFNPSRAWNCGYTEGVRIFALLNDMASRSDTIVAPYTGEYTIVAPYTGEWL